VSSPKQNAQTFPKSARLLRHADFESVYQNGRRHFAPHMTVFFLPRVAEEGAPPDKNQGNGPRIGFTVGRVLGNAVVRNRIKRRMREAVRRKLRGLTTSVDVVINPKKSAATAASETLQLEVERAFAAVAAGKGAVAQERPVRRKGKK
jgi:ribonuclease P protein component